MAHDRLEAAAQRVLAGDDSLVAAQDLEEVVLNDYPGDERLDDLGEVLALYRPGEGSPYVHAEALRSAITEALTRLHTSDT